MNDEDRIVAPVSMMNKEDAEDVYYQFVRLREKLEEERFALAKQNADLQNSIKRFGAEVREFERFRSDAQRKIQDSIQSAATNMAKEIGSQLKEDARDALQEVSRNLNNAADKTARVLSEANSNYELNAWKIAFGGLFVGIISALLITWFFMRDPVIINDNVRDAWNKGVTLEAFWPNLNHTQQQWLIDLSEGKVKNRNKSIEDMQEQQPVYN